MDLGAPEPCLPELQGATRDGRIVTTGSYTSGVVGSSRQEHSSELLCLRHLLGAL
jgi:hypothetical protein